MALARGELKGSTDDVELSRDHVGFKKYVVVFSGP